MTITPEQALANLGAHVCSNFRNDTPILCICAIQRDHDEEEFEAWENNDWQDPKAKQ